MSMSISEMYQEIIDQYNELYMYRKTHKGIREADPHEDILDDMSAVEVDMEYTNETYWSHP